MFFHRKALKNFEIITEALLHPKVYIICHFYFAWFGSGSGKTSNDRNLESYVAGPVEDLSSFLELVLRTLKLLIENAGECRIIYIRTSLNRNRYFSYF